MVTDRGLLCGGVDDILRDGPRTGVELVAGSAAGGNGLSDVADLGDVFEDVGDAERADDVDL